uniref:SCP domain-containing protein n=1 Tax=Strongyloides venezuelensis TaxID=75913 RepID=A0A0K0F423_STRVS
MLFFYSNYYIALILSIIFFQCQALENGARSNDIVPLNLFQNDEFSRNIIKRDTKIDFNAEDKEPEQLKKTLILSNQHQNNKKKSLKKRKTKRHPNNRKPKKSSKKLINDKFVHEKFAIISLFNELRLQHYSPVLEYNYKLSQEAQKLAIKLLKTKKWKHYKNSKYGVITYFTPNMKTQYTPIHYWIKGEKKINYKNLEKTIPRNYAQIVWASSKQIGCGISDKGPKKGSLTLCLFSPKGNIKGKYKSNIRKSIVHTKKFTQKKVIC